MLKRFLLILMLIFGWGLSSTIVEGQSTDVVYAVLFYSPSCSHCHQLITTDLPPIQEQFGDQFMVFYVDITTESGNALAHSAYEYYEIPSDNWAVPMMIVNEQVLLGGYQIPTELPGIIQTGLANGGIPIPSFPLMQDAFDEWQAANEGQVVSEGQATTESAVDTTSPMEAVKTTTPLSDSFQHDPLASIITIVILIALIASGITLMITHKYGLPMVVPRAVLLISTITTFGLALTIILADQQGDALALPIAGMILAGIMLSSGMAVFGERIRAAVSLTTFVGLVISVYMAYVEVTTNAAVCGAIGDCNAVQQSDYAYIFGIPIGIIGIIGYILMFGVSIAIMREPQQYLARLTLALQTLVGFSAVFTIYLTFLEPFVIGAVCAWCLMSALVVLNLMWLVMPMIQNTQRKRKPIQYLMYQPT